MVKSTALKKDHDLIYSQVLGSTSWKFSDLELWVLFHTVHEDPFDKSLLNHK